MFIVNINSIICSCNFINPGSVLYLALHFNLENVPNLHRF